VLADGINRRFVAPGLEPAVKQLPLPSFPVRIRGLGLHHAELRNQRLDAIQLHRYVDQQILYAREPVINSLKSRVLGGHEGSKPS
jgi:hypothetical protein